MKVALDLGRKVIGIELNDVEYLVHIKGRIAEHDPVLMRERRERKATVVAEKNLTPSLHRWYDE